ncbi:Protein of uncharacterised function (DUF559) [Actinobacillus seminis]|uniref:Protein of uncharacterized function (DUF559) n=1 Tax=Actinobacillus seminis TaxID=722 RepID=A0A380VFE3_9PAST|nr:Protein of uncharacterised function (DUF559) [Actinobacillus seminis]
MQPYSRDLKILSQKLRSTQTDAERKLWQSINRDQLLDFRFNRQKPLLNYIVDFTEQPHNASLHTLMRVQI